VHESPCSAFTCNPRNLVRAFCPSFERVTPSSKSGRRREVPYDVTGRFGLMKVTSGLWTLDDDSRCSSNTFSSPLPFPLCLFHPCHTSLVLGCVTVHVRCKGSQADGYFVKGGRSECRPELFSPSSYGKTCDQHHSPANYSTRWVGSNEAGAVASQSPPAVCASGHTHKIEGLLDSRATRKSSRDSQYAETVQIRQCYMP